MPGITTIYGGAGLKTEAEIAWYGEALDVLEKHGIKHLDSAKRYPNSEATIGKNKAGSRFTIDTKCGATGEGAISKDNIVAAAEDSLQKLGVGQVDVYFIHAPDSTVPIEDTLAGIDAVYRKGSFKRFGLSNYHADEVQQIHDLCKAKGYVLPSVYQGSYSAVSRKQESLLFPTLRKLGMSFYAYAPLAGGFLAKTRQQFVDGHGRFSKAEPMAPVFNAMWNKPSMLEALDAWEGIAKDAGCSKAALANRWVKYNSALKPEHGDGMIVGASRLEQLEQTLVDLDAGPLTKEIAERIEDIWKLVEKDASISSYEVIEKMKKMKAAQMKASQKKEG